MLLTRKIGSLLRGKATTPQILLAALFGGMLGFVPQFLLPGDIGGGFLQAPGLILGFFMLVAISNSNLGVFGLVTLAAKLLSFATLPLSYRVGEMLLDGPTQPLFKALINGKVSAWFGLEHYATTGGLAVGFGFGLACGLLLVKSVRAFRAKMATVEEAPVYQKYAGKRSVRFLGWLMFGSGHGKKVSYQQLASERRFGSPVRITGVLLVVLLAVTLWVTKEYFSEKYLTSTLRGGLESVNGATVDLEKAEIDLAKGTMTLAGLAVADSKSLDKDVFAAGKLEAVLDTGELLRKRFVIDRLVSHDASSGRGRKVPGRIVLGTTPPPPPPPPPPGTKTIDDYLKDAEVWRQRLVQAKEWLDSMTGGGKPAGPETKEDRRQREAEEVARYGYVRVVAKHLLEGAPAVLIRKIEIDGFTMPDFVGDVLDVKVSDLSSDPRLAGALPRLALASRATERLRFDLALGDAKGAVQPTLQLGLKGISADAVAAQLTKATGSPVLEGGTIELATKGSLRRGASDWEIDFPLSATLAGTTLALPGIPKTKLDRLALPIGVRGTLSAPAIAFDDRALEKALVDAGQHELANQVKARTDALLKSAARGLGEVVSRAITGSQPTQNTLEEAKKKAEQELQKHLSTSLPSFLGGKKK
jgi:hypothetical protein